MCLEPWENKSLRPKTIRSRKMFCSPQLWNVGCPTFSFFSRGEDLFYWHLATEPLESPHLWLKAKLSKSQFSFLKVHIDDRIWDLNDSHINKENVNAEPTLCFISCKLLTHCSPTPRLAADIYDKVSEELEKGGYLDCECVGGGRINHDPQAKKIHVYGHSIVRDFYSNKPWWRARNNFAMTNWLNCNITLTCHFLLCRALDERTTRRLLRSWRLSIQTTRWPGTTKDTKLTSDQPLLGVLFSWTDMALICNPPPSLGTPRVR